RLIRLLTPSKDKFAETDDILVDTLLRQRRQGSVARIVCENASLSVANAEDLAGIIKVANDVLAIIKVTNFVAEDDRPGILSFLLVRKVMADLYLGERLGLIDVIAEDFELAHVSAPMLLATA